MAKKTDQAGTGQTAAQTNGTFTITATQDRVTKNAVRFIEDHAVSTDPDRIGQIYMQKSAFPAGAPQQVRVTVESLG